MVSEGMTRMQWARSIVNLAMASLFTVVFILPLLKIAVMSTSHLHSAEVLMLAVRKTMLISAWVALITCALATVSASALYYAGSPKFVILFLVSLVVACSTLTVIRAESILVLFQPNSYLSEVAWLIFPGGQPGYRITSSISGVLIGLVHLFLPISIIYMYLGLYKVSLNAVRSSYLLSGSILRTGLIAFWPVVAPRLGYLFVSVFLMSITAFITPSLLGGGQAQMISVVIEERMRTSASLDEALVLGSIFSLGSLLILFVAGVFIAARKGI